tara:strand:- start:556 stop:1437 length:882 start_codon:yes stop_codon:yes gene_type:complete
MKKLTLFCGSTNLFSIETLNQIKKYYNCIFYKNLNQKSFEKKFYKYDILLCRFQHKIPFIKNSKLKYILSPTTGTDHIDLKYFRNKNIKIFNLSNKNKFLKNIHSSSEFTIYMILRLIKINQLKFSGFSKEINSKKICIIGYGRNGKKIAKILKAFGAKISFFDKYINNKTNLNNLIKISDIVSINIPLNKKTENFFDHKKIKMMKKNALLINSSRGEIVDEKYIVKNLSSIKIFYASDVPSNNVSLKGKLYTKNKNRLFFSNHIAGLSEESVKKTDFEIIKDFNKFLKNNII